MGLHLLAVLAMVHLTEPLAVHCRATAVPQVLSQLSKTSGVSLTAEGDAKSEIVLIDVEDVPLKTLMEKVAVVTSCSWKEQGSGYCLTPNGAQRKKEEQGELRARSDRIGAWLSMRNREVEEMRNAPTTATIKGGGRVSNEDFKRWTKKLFSYDPAERACLQVLSLLGSETVAGLPVGQEAVWVTSRPTVFQTELPYVEPPIADLLTDRYEMFSEGQIDTPMTTPIRRVMLVIKPLKDQILVSLNCYDDQQQSISGGSASIQIPLSDASLGQDSGDGSGTMERPAVELSTESTRILEIVSKDGQTGNALRFLEPAFRKKFADVAHNDPLSFFASDALFYYGRSFNRQIVASLPDDYFQETLSAFQRRQDRSDAVLATVDHGGSLKVSLDESFALIRPSKPATNRYSRFNRTALGALLTKNENSGFPTLAELASFSLDDQNPNENPTAKVITDMFWPSYLPYEAGTWPALQLLGSLDQEQEEALLKDQPLSFAGLNDFQRQLVIKEALSFNESGSALPGNPAFGPTDPSEFLPHSLDKGFLTLSKSSLPILFAASDKDHLYRWTLMANAYAQIATSFKSGYVTRAIPAPSKGKIGRQDIYAIGFHFGQDTEVERELRDLSIPTDSPLLPDSQFPEEFLKDFDSPRDTSREGERPAGKTGIPR